MELADLIKEKLAAARVPAASGRDARSTGRS